MPITELDVAILKALANFYVLTREQIQRILFSNHASGRSTRKRLTKLRQAGYIQKHRIPVVLPGLRRTKRQPATPLQGRRGVEIDHQFRSGRFARCHPRVATGPASRRDG